MTFAFRGSFQEGCGLTYWGLIGVWFIGLHFMDLQGSFVPGAKIIIMIIFIIIKIN